MGAQSCVQRFSAELQLAEQSIHFLEQQAFEFWAKIYYDGKIKIE